MASGGPGKSNGNSNSPNDRELERKRQEAYDQLRRREEGNLILKVFRVQKDIQKKYSLAGPLNIWKIIIIGKDCQMMRLRVFEYPRHKVYEFSSLQIAHLKMRGLETFRGLKLLYVHHQGKRPVVNQYLTRLSYRGRKNFEFKLWRENFVILAGNFES